LLAYYRILYLDGIRFPVRHGTQTDSTIILVALAWIWKEDKDGWSCLFQDLRTRGAAQMDLIVTEGYEANFPINTAVFSLINLRNHFIEAMHRIREWCNHAYLLVLKDHFRSVYPKYRQKEKKSQHLNCGCAVSLLVINI
jgi:transposase-like protein